MRYWKIALRELFGGQGSGNFGHAGRPGEVGGSMVAYHGMSVRHIDSVRRDGLKRGQSWHGRKPAVYFTDDVESAKDFGKAYAGIKRQYAVVAFRIPDSESKNILTDTEMNDGHSYLIHRDIPASWIVSIDIHDKDKYSDGASKVFYTVVLIDDGDAQND